MKKTVNGISGRWKVSARPVGEVLTATVRLSGVQAIVAGVPTGRTRREVEGRLHDLIESAHHAAGRERVPRPIPATLHHTIVGLGRWLAELGPAAVHVRALALYASDRSISCAHIGGMGPHLVREGSELDPPWIEFEPVGERVVRACALYGPRSGVRLEWSSAGEGEEVLQVTARWRVRGGRPATLAVENLAPELKSDRRDEGGSSGVAAMDTAEETVTSGGDEVPNLNEVEVVAESTATAEDPDLAAGEPVTPVWDLGQQPNQARRSGFFGWLDRLVARRRQVAAPVVAIETESSDLPFRIEPERGMNELEGVARAPGLLTIGTESDAQPAPEVPVAPGPRTEQAMALVGSLKPRPGESVSDPVGTASRVASICAEEEPHGGGPRPTPETIAEGPGSGRSDAESERPEPPGEDSVTQVAEEPEATAAAGDGFADPGRGSFFTWLDRIVARRRQKEAPGESPIAHDVPGVPDWIPPPPPEAVEIGPEPSAAALGVEEQTAAEAGSVTPEVEPEVVPEPTAGHPENSPGGSVEALAVTEVQEVEPVASPAFRHIAPKPIRAAWPDPSELGPRRSQIRRLVPATLVVIALFSTGWWLGGAQNRSAATDDRPIPARVMAWLGIDGGRFECEVRSTPAGAWIQVDGKDLGQRTPAVIRLQPGEHQVTLSLVDQGGSTFTVRGDRGGRMSLEAVLLGALMVHAPETGTPIAVSVDGVPRGFAPLAVPDLTPGPHELGFSGAGLTPWGQAVEIRVGETIEITPRPFHSPETGVIEVRASGAGEEGTQDVKGAEVWVDGERRGTTPVAFELARGPHSIRVRHRGDEAPIQVIDLPGGNQRFAHFHFTSGWDAPSLTLLAPRHSMPRDRPTMVSAALEGVNRNDVQEMWLHVRTPEGPWRRYPMVLLASPGGVAGASVFPLALLDEQGRAPFYVSAITRTGDEHYTELQSSDYPKGKTVPTGPSKD